MRLVFAGSEQFSLTVLRHLAGSSHRVALVLTPPERAGSRGGPAPRPVRALAERLGLAVAQPARLSRSAWEEMAAPLGVAVLVVAAYGQLIPASVLRGLERGGLGVHPSLLPRHRGASPVAAAILGGDRETGVSIFSMNRELDAGPILAQGRLALSGAETTPELTQRLSEQGADLLLQVLDRLEQGPIPARPQPTTGVSYAPRLSRADGHLEWLLPAAEIGRRLRALQPWPGVTVPLGGREVKLLEGEPVAGPPGTAPGSPGQVMAMGEEAAEVQTPYGRFRVDRVLPPGGRAMSAAAYLRGRPAEKRLG